VAEWVLMDEADSGYLIEIAKLIRYWILSSTTKAGSGHPTSSLSAVELMVGLLFGGIFRYDLDKPALPNNDRLIFSKGHAAPLLYSLFTAAGAIKENELGTLRKLNSPLEGHPSINFPYTEVATGSLGQGLSIGLGMALNAKYLDNLPYKTYVLLGDSEMSEGSVWEAIQVASYYKLGNLIGIIDVNRLGQRGETMVGHDLDLFYKRISAFGWNTITVDGHDFSSILKAFKQAFISTNNPTMLIAKTIKGKGVSFLEDKENWHGKILTKDQFKLAIQELGNLNFSLRGSIKKAQDIKPKKQKSVTLKPLDDPAIYHIGDLVSTRKAYGIALARLGTIYPEILALDAEVKNSTFSQIFEEYFPDRFFEMYIAEQNMVGSALGLSLRGKIPFVSTFSAFFSRAHDQLRMLQYSNANVKFIGSHAGVSIGEDGPSQMGLEDIGMFRSLLSSAVLYPSDAVSCEKLVKEAINYQGIVYLRTTRNNTPVIYKQEEHFPIGKCKILRRSNSDVVTVVTAGITLHQALAAYEELTKKNTFIRVVDLYSIKPIDIKTLRQCATETKAIITVEDHYPEGGIGEAVRSALSNSTVPIVSLAVSKKPKSGTSQELLDYECISKQAIIAKVLEILQK